MADAIVTQSGERKRGGSVVSKLVRDKIPDIIRESGETPVTRKVTGLELRAALIDKLEEELDEFFQASSRDAVMEELADILEVVYALGGSYGSTDELLSVSLVKRLERGGFDEGFIWQGNES
jgi:predicted house-cleaning noncanonical NTP pyrophosphatase (MazG superfamily)